MIFNHEILIFLKNLRLICGRVLVQFVRYVDKVLDGGVQIVQTIFVITQKVMMIVIIVICLQRGNKSESKELFGHSIKNPQIKHLLVHELDYNPFGAIHASVIIHYLCMGACGITPEKSTWKLEEVTCKNCLRDVKTVLHKKDYRGMVKAIYDGELYDYIPDCNLPPFCDTCMHENGALCDWLHKCPYNQLMNRMKNGLKD